MNKARIAAAAGIALAAGLGLSALALAQDAGPYKVLKIAKVGGEGGFDYVYADVAGRKLYVPRSGQQDPRVTVFNLDTLAPIGEIKGLAGHGVAVDPKSHHGFASSKPILMFDSETLKEIKRIDVQGGPDGIFYDPYNARVWVFSHQKPHATIIEPKDGTIVGTIDDLGGAPEQAASDGKGHVWVDLESSNAIAAVDAKTLKVTATYDISAKGKAPAGLAYDPKADVLFADCREPAVMVAVSAKDGKVLEALPIGPGTDGGGFNAKTSEVFSSNGGDGTLTVVKVKGPTSFAVEENVKTMPRAKTMTVDPKTDHVILIAAEYGPPPAAPPAAAGGAPGRGGRGRGAPMIPDSFSLIMVGK